MTAPGPDPWEGVREVAEEAARLAHAADLDAYAARAAGRTREADVLDDLAYLLGRAARDAEHALPDPDEETP